MKSVETEGKNLKEAIQIALNKLGVTRDKVKVKVLYEGKNGLFGMKGFKQAKVKVSLKETRPHPNKP